MKNDTASKWRVGIDIGGTFTDIVAINPKDNTIRVGKVPSRYEDPVGAIVEAITSLELEADDIDVIVHGTTRVTNAIIEGTMAPVALLATDGFEDSIEIARLSRAELYHLDVPPKLPPLAPSERRIPVAERMAYTGDVLKPLSAEEISRVVAQAKSLGIDSVAVSLLHSYANGTHERQLGQALADAGLHVSLSHQINPEAREYERTAVTLLDAAVTPIAVNYLGTLENEPLIKGKLRLFHSAGGMATPDAVRNRPLVMAMSGPAAGVAATARLGGGFGHNSLLTFDMGGTTTDVCLVQDGEADISVDKKIAGRPIRMPMVAVESIGAGGGSIVRVDTGGLTIGPDSAGANPGPAAYGNGGTQATITDISVVLGYMNLDKKLGGRMTLDRDAAIKTITPMAEKLGMGIAEFALGTAKVANAVMSRALRRVTVERGVDGRNCALVAFGGAAPLYAAGLARMYGICDVVVPRASSVFSALGCVVADTSYTDQRTIRSESDTWNEASFAAHLAEARTAVLKPFLDEGISEGAIQVEHTALVRYVGQSSEVATRITLPHDISMTGESFRKNHDQLYGFATDESFEIVSLRTVGVLPSGVSATVAPGEPNDGPTLISTGDVWFDAEAPVSTPRYDRATCAAGRQIYGPAILEDASSTVVVPPNWSVTANAAGDLLMKDHDHDR
ncbi:hydantoinase/oxoprolinase family protein [Leisingera sp. S232]|uniref:hydantoinase/oxoprolinase family protein n=1 Tax=Leisingera sp. S232 TaxID=3415132 RepID=UPI00086BCE70|nr:hypothetical protein AB838_16380 [Rhodobacteraceae bacterium (ex Bugula neritina AB1)]